MSCEPRPKKPTVAYSTLSYCERLAVVEDGLMQLATGKAKAIVRHGEFIVEYHEGSVTFLERERARLQRLCPTSSGSHGAITIGRTTGRRMC